MKQFLWSLLGAAFVSAAPSAAPAPGLRFQRVVMVVLENTSYDEAMEQPFLKSLAARGASFANFNAEAHPSQPNYIALVSGSTQGVSDDENVNIDARHLGDLLDEKGYGWRAYAEDYPGGCFLGEARNKFARKHVPFLSFRNVQTDQARCGRVVNASQFDADISAGTLPQFALYIPNLNNDGHDTNPAFADAWLKKRFEALLADPAFSAGTLFVVTFDENDDALGFGPGNQIFTVMVGPMVQPGIVIADPVDHYSLLRLVEDNWSLGRLSEGDAGATPIAGVFR